MAETAIAEKIYSRTPTHPLSIVSTLVTRIRIHSLASRERKTRCLLLVAPHRVNSGFQSWVCACIGHFGPLGHKYLVSHGSVQATGYGLMTCHGIPQKFGGEFDFMRHAVVATMNMSGGDAWAVFRHHPMLRCTISARAAAA